MAWIYLLIAGFLEIAWALLLKETKGFSKPIPSALTITLMIVSFFFLSRALTVIPIGVAYAVWTGIGAAGTAVFGALLFHEPWTFLRFLCISAIVFGVAGLKLLS